MKSEPGSGSPQAASSPAPPKAAAGGEWNVIPLKACTREELADTRNHILKFHTKQDVDIIKDFVKPVRMHRKDPQNIQFQLTREEMDRRKREGSLRDPNEPELVPETDGNPENALVADMSQVAPDGGARRHRKNLFKRKTKQVHVMDEAKRKLRYEEYYPWVVEDYNGSNVFVGSYEAGSSESTHVLFVFDKDGFKMVPAEKVYKFTPRNKYATLTLEEAEARMEKNLAAPRWLMKHMDEEGTDMRFKRTGSGQFGAPVRATSGPNSLRMRTVQGGAVSQDRDSDHDDLDFDEEFADDEEAPIMDGDEEENKLLERKIKREMLKAAHLGGDPGEAEGDSDDDLNDLFEVEKLRKVDKEGKKLKKVLNRTEGAVYESDNEEIAPYVSQSDLESEEESEPEIPIKEEPGEGVSLHRGPAHRTLFVSSIADGMVVIRAPKQFLQDFPRGEWNPNARKRPQTFDTPSPGKRAKVEEPSNSISVLPVPEDAATGNLDFAGQNNELVTTQEVLDIVRHNPLTTKELLLKLKNRISTHKNNKLRIITIVKLNLKLVDGKLVLKDD